MPIEQPTDLVLSSGWLAFASHAGFLAAIEEAQVPVDGICGTSSGSLAGALFASGMPATEIFALLTRHPPLRWVRPSIRPWRGLFHLGPMIAELERHLPPTVAALDRPFGAGVIDRNGFRLLTEGPLPYIVAASCAVPYIFRPIEIDGVAYQDGGVADRTGLDDWRALRGNVDPIVHVLAASYGPELPVHATRVVPSPRSGAYLWSLGDVEARFERTRAATLNVLN
ncbi:MAG: patatin-like phospholipase family protein [Myxococcota bacterium]